MVGAQVILGFWALASQRSPSSTGSTLALKLPMSLKVGMRSRSTGNPWKTKVFIPQKLGFQVVFLGDKNHIFIVLRRLS